MAEASVALKPLWVRPRGVAQLLDCGLTRVYELIDRDEIVSVLDGHTRRISVASIEAYIQRKFDAQAGQKVREVRAAKLPKVRKSSRPFGSAPRPPRARGALSVG
jgi:excisionase family DNA binding protein